jgi:histidinol-phosphate aminotransferase
LRITVGTEKEVDRFLLEIASVLKEIHEGGGTGRGAKEERKEKDASGIVA